MNVGIIGGIIAGFLSLAASVIFAGGSLLLFWDIPSVFLVVVGSACALAVAYPISKIMEMPTYARKAIFPEKYNPVELIVTLVQFSEKSRREGLLALEDDLDALEDLFLKKGLQLVVDGTDPELVRVILETDIEQMAERHEVNKSLFDDYAAYAPSFGMMGTLLGLIMLLVNLNDRAMFGPYLSVALITTLYGAIVAFLIFGPLGRALELLTNEEVVFKSVAVTGVLSIQAGDNPRILKEKLVAFITPEMRTGLLEDEKGE